MIHENVSAVITGGAGFIGSHLTDLLIKTGADVTVIDNLVNGRLENLSAHTKNPRFHFVKADIRDFSLIEPLFAGKTHVFHLAALADIVPSITNPVAYHTANVDGTVNVLESIRKNGSARVVYAASSSCYGLPAVFPTSEMEPVKPQYPYALTKYIGEQYLLHWAKVYKIPAVSLRLFNVYGSRSRTSGTYGAVFGVFLRQKIAGTPFTIVGDGTQTRDFTFVTDVAQAFYTAAFSDVSGEIMNVGSGGHYSVNELAALIGGEKVSIPKRPGEPDCTFADTAKIKKLLNWQPKVSFTEGVKIVLDNIDYWKNAPLWDPQSIAAETKAWFDSLS